MNEVLNKNMRDAFGKMHGYWESYYSNGNFWHKGNYNNGQKHGYWEEYYFNGNLCNKGNYLNNKMHGYWVWFNVDGGKVIEYYFL